MAGRSQEKQQPIGLKKEHYSKWLLLILALYFSLATGYSLATPLFEAPDENHHFFNALAIHETGQLPRTDQDPGPARQEAAQPPLYYWAASWIIGGVDLENGAESLWPNPYVQLGNANSPDNANAFIHTQAEAFPWRGLALAAHLVRFWSVLLGGGTLLFLFGSARLIWPDTPHKALLATALVAFLPQFGFLHGSISNDPLMIFLATAVLFQLLNILLNQKSTGRLLLLGLTLGLGLLAKTTGILLLVWAAGWLFLIFSWRQKRPDWQTAVYLLVPALLVGGWWLVRNWLLYGDITAANQFVALAGGNRHFTLGQIAAELDRVWLSAVAFFGWMTVRPPIWIHWLWSGIAALAAGGGLWRWWHLRGSVKVNWLLWAVLASWFALVFLGWLQFMRQTSAEQGRLLFPALAAATLLLTAGIAGWQRSWLFSLSAGAALLTSCYALFAVLPQAYGVPLPLSADQVPSTDGQQTTTFNQDLGQGLTLIAAQTDVAAAHPGYVLEITLFWQAAAPPTEPPTLVIELFGREQALVGKILSYHGSGRFPANLWQPEAIYRDSYWVQLDPGMTTPTIVRPVVHLLDEESSAALPPVKVTAVTQPAPQTAVATFGDAVALVEAKIVPETAVAGEQISVRLTWQVREPLHRSLTTFVHLGEQTTQPLAQGDGLPLNGDYPTQFWGMEEQIPDSYSLSLPAGIPSGKHPIYVGLYDPVTGSRLPAADGDDVLPYSAYLVGYLMVSAHP